MISNNRNLHSTELSEVLELAVSLPLCLPYETWANSVEDVQCLFRSIFSIEFRIESQQIHVSGIVLDAQVRRYVQCFCASHFSS